jgi:hypothetical protein
MKTARSAQDSFLKQMEVSLRHGQSTAWLVHRKAKHMTKLQPRILYIDICIAYTSDVKPATTPSLPHALWW